ncbi:MAG: imidazole glycerol phosphate synthase subunit HisH [Candidatus Omnitrophica bacterium]|nr:imidazole glycerol phosphate synthase subunit HisH [Candidatus Omnitrophota bacterium]
MICVIDYGMGNLRSVSKAIETMGGRTFLGRHPRDLKRADKIVLPGVGEFGHAMQALSKQKLIEPLQEILLSGEKPFLGICLGLQLLFESSEENRKVPGLKIFKGSVQRFPKKKIGLKVPQMGWNQVRFLRSSPFIRKVPNQSYFYFVHSFYATPHEQSLDLGITEYGVRFASVIEKEPIFAVQFHPEKSQAAGLKILKNFVAY